MSGEKEIEAAFMIEITDFAGLDQANAVEEHLQYEYKPSGGMDGVRRGKQRIRKTTKDGESIYEETLKLPIDPENTQGDVENTVVISQAHFQAWSKVFQVRGTKKIRYSFIAENTKAIYQGQEVELPRLVYELDLFLNEQGKRAVWAKADIELQDAIAYLKERFEDFNQVEFKVDFSGLPCKVGKVVPMNTEDPTERAAITNFFDKFCCIPPGEG